MTTAKRSSAMPEVPTIAESGAAYGLAGFDINTWFGLFGPAGLPPATTQRLNKAFTEALASPEIKARLATLLAEPSPTTPEQFAAFVRSELVKYEKVVKASGPRPTEDARTCLRTFERLRRRSSSARPRPQGD